MTTAQRPEAVESAWTKWSSEHRPTMPNVSMRGFKAGYAAACRDYDSLALAARNTADDAERYFLAWTSARERAARTAALLARLAEAEALLRRCEERVRHDHAYPMEFGPHHCDGCDLKADLRAALAGGDR